MNLQDKVAIVTGGSMGIGFATAQALAKEGCRIAICARSAKQLREAEKQLSGITECLAVKCDVSKAKEVQRFFSKVKKKFGTIDILVNNAGIFAGKNFSQTDEKEWNSVIDVNLKGVMLCTQYALPLMGKGIIVNISSGAGKTGFGGMAAYCASKFGVIGFTESLAEELRGIKVYAVCPGGVDTRMWSRIARYRPMLKPHHIAGKIVELCALEKPRSGSSVEVYSIPELVYIKAKEKFH